MTHGLVATGAGGTAAAAKTKIGSTITLPAGGPWTISGLWGQVAKITTAANEGTGGQLIIDALTGDLDPDPAPGKYPLIGNSAGCSANEQQSEMPLNIWPVAWKASGKSQIDLSYVNQLAITTASRVAAGIIFGDEVPEYRPLVFCDSVYAAFASATETAVGTITLAEKATRIVGLLADLSKGDAWTAAEAVIGYVRLDSADVKLTPAQFPFNRCYNATLGTHAGQASTPRSDFIPLDIPVVGGARIDVYATTSAAITGNCEALVYVAYE